MSTQYEIARLLFEWDLRWHPEPRPTWDTTTERHRAAFIEAADAILARFPILRDELPDEVVEAAVVPMFEWVAGGGDKWHDEPEPSQMVWRVIARFVLSDARAVRDT